MYYSQKSFVQEIVQFLVGFICGYIICHNLYNNKGEHPNFSPTIPLIGMVNGHQYIGSLRIHHWMWGIFGIILSLFYELYLVCGICFFFMLHGLSYDDCFDLS